MTDVYEYEVERDGDLNIKFTGHKIGFASSHDNDSVGRWTELTLYKTQGGKFICEQIGYTRWDGERNFHSGAVCNDADAVIEFLGTGWLAKEVYADAGIDASVTVD